MSVIFSEGHEAVTVSNELLELLSAAYQQQGRIVEIPRAVVEGSCFDLSSETSNEINAIRRRERTASTQTLSFSFA